MTLTDIQNASGANTVTLDRDAVYSGVSSDRFPTHMPLFVPRDQAYYWSFNWQQDIRESLNALQNGDYEDFDSDDPNDVVRWLFTEEN